MDNRREQIIEIIKKEFIGPDPIDKPGLIQENGEEILSSDPPGIRYIAGILFPQKLNMDASNNDYDPNNEEENATGADDYKDDESVEVSKDYLQEVEELMNLSNSYRQSAMSITVAVEEEDKVYVNVSSGIYKTIMESDNDTEKKKQKYLRVPIAWNNDNKPITMAESEPMYTVAVTNDGEETFLRFHSTFRYKKNDSYVYTITLENSKVSSTESVKDEDCYFQVEFSLTSEKGFHPLPENENTNLNDLDFLSNQMMYRDVKNYSIGHGCSATWETIDGKVKTISTSIFPSYEIKPIVPNKINNVTLEMLNLSDHSSKDFIINELASLCDEYEKWIIETEKRIVSIKDKETAIHHISECKNCLSRMKEGVDLLNTDEKVLLAFQLMNKAMLYQQLHYNLPLQSWASVGNKIVLENPIKELPILEDKNTWGENRDRFGKWRPFQLAFILINLKSMYYKKCSDRNIVDLIWFPTGGGKTEAYLGLSAYTIFIKRLVDKNDSGTSIFMRYTLRLLTSQQYERASSMICACEYIRSSMPEKLGESRISIGLWVGGETSPNNMVDAVKAYERIYKGEVSDNNPFIVLKCPWCGAQMGVVTKDVLRETPGYKKINKPKKAIVLQCANTEYNCFFSKDGNELPLYTIDDEIYEKTPTLLLGTVDKFAMLPFRPEAQSLFGIDNGKRVSAPDLIIQDELHLISGPLGSMVGHYETMINELCSYEEDGVKIKPKIIASTATISRASEQCHALYDCSKENVKQFPPSGIDAGDSFFAKEDNKSVGRKYVGILASGSSSMATTMIRLYATLLYAAKAIQVDQEFERDPYWTNVGYFNSIRELGQTETWIHADIDEYLHVIYKRRYEDKEEGYKENRRYIYVDKELTSRIRSDKIPSTLQEMSVSYPQKDDNKKPVDICLATNMISVGVDVPRLGLMTVSGQPKTTSEYIQATSRVGRSQNSPGLVFTVYNPGKPRDKSHYEQFVSYHSKIYCNVEPTSVTPFSSPLRERALHALIIGIYRLEGDKNINAYPNVPDRETVERIKKIIYERVSNIDPDELQGTMEQIDEILENWEIWQPKKYQDFSVGEEVPLMYPAGTLRNEQWGEHRGFKTPTSMRSVDASCEAKVLESKYSEEQ